MLRPLPALALAALLVVTGCTDPEGDAAAPAEPGATSAAPSAPPPTAEPEPLAPVDPCSMTERYTWIELVPKELRSEVSLRRDLSTFLPGIYSCRISDTGTDTAVATFGYSIGPVDWQAIEKRTKPGLVTERTSIPALGDEAFYSTGLAGVEAYAREGEHVVAMAIYEATDVNAIRSVMASMLVDASESWTAFPVDLPEGCPREDDPVVTGVLGRDIAYARGDFRVTSRPVGKCTYLNADGQAVSASIERWPDSAWGQVQEFILDTGTVVDPPPGPVRAVLRKASGGNTYSIQSASPETGDWVIVSTSVDGPGAGPLRSGEREATQFLERGTTLIGRQLSTLK